MGWSRTVAGKNPYALFDGQAPGRPDLWHHRSAERPPCGRRAAVPADHRLLGSRPPGHEPAVAIPRGVESEGQLLVALGPAFSEVGIRVSEGLHRSAGRESALRPEPIRRPVHPADRRRRQQPLQPGRLHVRPAIDLRAQQPPGRQPGPGHAFSLRAGRLARERSADAQSGSSLRVRDAVGRREQHPLELRSGDAVDGDCPRWLGRGALDHHARSQQLRSARRLCLHASLRRPSCGAATASATCTSTAPAAQTCCPSTVRR